MWLPTRGWMGAAVPPGATFQHGVPEPLFRYGDAAKYAKSLVGGSRGRRKSVPVRGPGGIHCVAAVHGSAQLAGGIKEVSQRETGAGSKQEIRI